MLCSGRRRQQLPEPSQVFLEDPEVLLAQVRRVVPEPGADAAGHEVRPGLAHRAAGRGGGNRHAAGGALLAGESVQQRGKSPDQRAPVDPGRPPIVTSGSASPPPARGAATASFHCGAVPERSHTKRAAAAISRGSPTPSAAISENIRRTFTQRPLATSQSRISSKTRGSWRARFRLNGISGSGSTNQASGEEVAAATPSTRHWLQTKSRSFCRKRSRQASRAQLIADPLNPPGNIEAPPAKSSRRRVAGDRGELRVPAGPPWPPSST